MNDYHYQPCPGEWHSGGWPCPCWWSEKACKEHRRRFQVFPPRRASIDIAWSTTFPSSGNVYLAYLRISGMSDIHRQTHVQEIFPITRHYPGNSGPRRMRTDPYGSSVRGISRYRWSSIHWLGIPSVVLLERSSPYYWSRSAVDSWTCRGTNRDMWEGYRWQISW